MITLNIQDKDLKKSFKQIKRWFNKNPNRKTANIKNNKDIIVNVTRSDYIK